MIGIYFSNRFVECLNSKSLLAAIILFLVVHGGISAEDGKIVPLSSLPAAAQKTLQTQLVGGQVGEIEQTEANGDILFDVTIIKSSVERSVKVGGDGTLLSVEIDVAEAPPVVRAAIQKQIGRGKIDNINKSFDDGEVSYEVDYTTLEGVERSFTLAADGKVERLQVFLPEIPVVVRKAIEQNAANATLGDIFRTFTDGEIAYDVDITRDGKDRDFTVGADGKLESKEMFLEELPAAARKTVTEKIGNGKILRIDEAFEKRAGVFPFEVVGRKDGKPFNFSVGPKGRFLGMDD